MDRRKETDMCLALPAEVITILADQRAVVNVGGVTKEISTALLDQIAVGDFVIIHVGYALTLLNETEAKKTLQLFSEMLDGADVR